MLNSLFCRANYLLVRCTLTSLESSLITSIETEQSPIIPSVENILEDVEVGLVCILIDGPATEGIERVCSVGSDMV